MKKEVTLDHPGQLNQERSAQSSEFSLSKCNVQDRDNSTFASTHLGRELVPYSSLNPEQLKHLEQMGLTPHETIDLLPVEIHFQEWGSDLWIGKNINPLVIGRYSQLMHRKKMSHTQACKAIQDVAVKLGFYPDTALLHEGLKSTQKHLPSTV